MAAQDTTVKFFDSSMQGAPTLSNVAGNLISVLDACLVDGFGLKTCDSVVVAGGIATATISTGHSALPGSVVQLAGATPSGLNGQHKVISITTNTVVFDAYGVANGTATGTITLKMAPAGWVKQFSGTNLAAYKSGNVAATGSYVRVDDTGTTSARIRGYVNMSDINTGTDPFPTDDQISGGGYINKSDGGVRRWWAVANDRFCYIGTFGSYQQHALINGFGDIVSKKVGDAYRFALFAQSADRAASNNSHDYNPIFGIGSSSIRVMPRSYSALGSAVAINPAWFGSSISGWEAFQFPNPVDNGIMFSTVHIKEGSAARGAMPGSFATPQSIRTGIGDGYILDEVSPTGRKMMYRQFASDYSTGGRGGCFFDVTGPWSN